MSTYVDSSVLLRIVFREPDPLREWRSLEPASSQLIQVECLRAIERLRHMSVFTDVDVVERRQMVIDALSRFRLIAPSSAVLDRAADPFPVFVATLDALHLATAMELRSEVDQLDFATHDAKLAAAARSVGFNVIGI